MIGCEDLAMYLWTTGFLQSAEGIQWRCLYICIQVFFMKCFVGHSWLWELTLYLWTGFLGELRETSGHEDLLLYLRTNWEGGGGAAEHSAESKGHNAKVCPSFLQAVNLRGGEDMNNNYIERQTPQNRSQGLAILLWGWEKRGKICMVVCLSMGVAKKSMHTHFKHRIYTATVTGKWETKREGNFHKSVR